MEDAIRSVVEQDCFDKCELIVVDGGSTDNSLKIIKKYADKISWWVSERDKGQSDAFNKGFKKAHGRFGCWLNADDLLMPGALAMVVDFIAAHADAQWIGASSVFADANLDVLWCSRSVRTPMFGARTVPFYSVNGPSSFFLIENLHRVGGFDVDLRYTMDTDLWRRFSLERIKLFSIKRYVWCFRVHEKSKTSHKFMTGVSTDAFATECEKVNLRYGITRKKQKLGNILNRVLRLVSGAYLKSYVDTKRFRGKSVLTIAKRR